MPIREIAVANVKTPTHKQQQQHQQQQHSPSINDYFQNFILLFLQRNAHESYASLIQIIKLWMTRTERKSN